MFKHKLVQGLYDLLQEWTSSKVDISNPVYRGLWMGFKDVIPFLLRDLDDSPESVEAIRSKLASVLVETAEEPPPISTKVDALPEQLAEPMLEEESQEEREREEDQEV